MAKKHVNVEAQTITQEVPFELYPANQENQYAYLSQLKPLDVAPIPHAKIAMRETSKDNVSNLYESILAGDELPPITVAASNIGWIIIDGYHRTAAYTEHMIAVLYDAHADVEGYEPTPEEIEEAMKSYSVRIREVTVADNIDLMDKAFSANLAHGLPASPASRSRYALWMIEQAAARGEELKIRAAARKAHVSHVAVLNLKARLAAKDEKMKDDLASDDKEEVEALMEEEQQNKDDSVSGKTEKHVKAMIAAVKFLYDQDMTSEELTLYLNDFGKSLEKRHANFGLKVFNNLYTVAGEDAPIEQQQLV